MKNVAYSKMGLFLALVVVGSECGRVKRQDLIPSPRVGKRTLLRTMGGPGDMAGVLMEDMDGVGVMLEDGSNPRPAGTKIQATMKNQFGRGGTELARGSDDALLSPTLKLILRSATDAAAALPHQERDIPGSSFSIKSRHNPRQRKSSYIPTNKTSELNPWVFHHLLQRLSEVRPEEIEQYLRETMAL